MWVRFFAVRAVSSTALLGAIVAAGCGGSTESDGVSRAASGGDGGATTTGRGGNQSGGTDGTTGGSGSTGGTGGPATGGLGGGSKAVGGGGGAGRECMRDADCEILGDCCGCHSVTNGTISTCSLDCASDHCRDFATAPTARCAFGQCVLDVSCIGTVVCPALPPSCGPGQVPTIVGGCYGPCIDAPECRAVEDCQACNGPGQACLYEYGAVGVAHCVAIPTGCDPPRCSCMSGLCGAIEPCQDLPNGIQCGNG
jgi:hypothetical protein